MFHFLCLRLARHVAHALARMHQRTIAPRELQMLDDYALRDIDLSHRAAAECSALATMWQQSAGPPGRRSTP